MMTWAQLGFQDANSPVMEEFLYFHDFAMVVLTGIIVGVVVMLGGAMLSKSVGLGLLEAQTMECIWTLVPALILVQLAVPSLLLLYMVDESATGSVTLKAVGHQWYWSYEYSDFWRDGKTVELDAYLESSELPRLLSTDSSVVLPVGAQMRVLVGSADVLHAWAIPSFGVKVDACPGRLNQVSMCALRPGAVYGQCSEICGANHSFMPISIEVGSAADFISWVDEQLN